MDKKSVAICISIVLLAIWLFPTAFKTTGSAVNDQKLLLSLDIPSDQQKINPGESLLLEVDIRVPGGIIDQTSTVELEYSVKDLKGNLISSKKESGAIAVKESEVASLLIPTSTKSGVYTAFVDITYQGDTYEASKTFEVAGKFNISNNMNIIIYALAGLIALTILIIIIREIRNRRLLIE